MGFLRSENRALRFTLPSFAVILRSEPARPRFVADLRFAGLRPVALKLAQELFQRVQVVGRSCRGSAPRGRPHSPPGDGDRFFVDIQSYEEDRFNYAFVRWCFHTGESRPIRRLSHTRLGAGLGPRNPRFPPRRQTLFLFPGRWMWLCTGHTAIMSTPQTLCRIRQ